MNNLLEYKIFQPYKYLLAFSTTKKTLEAQSPRFTGDTPEIFRENRQQLAKILGIEPQQLVFPRQTHTRCVAGISEIPLQEITETDALVTNHPGICLCVQTADCVPILLFDPAQNVISAVHAGWRGTVSKIAEAAVQKMMSGYQSSPRNILALIGPSISPGIYEVGDEVVSQARANIPGANETLHKKSQGKYHFNLWEANRRILLGCGLKPENIEISGECSFTEKDKYFSARRDGVETGRMVSGILLMQPFVH